MNRDISDGRVDTYASMVFIVKGFISVNESNAEFGRDSSIVLSAGAWPLRRGLMFSCNARLLQPGPAFLLRMLLHWGMSMV